MRTENNGYGGNNGITQEGIGLQQEAGDGDKPRAEHETVHSGAGI